MSNIKKTIAKIIVLVLIFIAVVTAYFLLTHKTKEETSATMGDVTLPTITLQANSIEVNELHGYTQKMNNSLMRDSITPIDENRNLQIAINNNQNVVVKVAFEVRSLDGERLIEDTDVESFISSDGVTKAILNISNMIEKDKEYLFIIKLSTEQYSNIYYYTRIMQVTDDYYTEQIEFVKDFSNKTLNDDEDIVPYLEPKSDSDNTNLAYVNIYSSYKQVTWADLAVERVTTPVISIKEIFGDVGCYELKYKVQAKNEYDTYQFYNVTEYYRVRKTTKAMYLYVYERKAEQILEPTSQNISASRVNLGLDSDKTIEYQSSETGSYVAFVKERSLFLMNMNSNIITTVFSFAQFGDNNTQTNYDHNDIEPVAVDSDGNVEFMVYGYMNKGEHAGQTGVALYKYNKESNEVNELVFVPSDKPFEILKESIGKLAYVNSKNILYIMLDESIYSISLDSNEYVELVSGLQDSAYIINNTNTIIAWHINNTVNNADSVRVLNISTGEDKTITADNGKKLKLLGFVENDLVYGIANESDIITDSNGITTFAMSELKIIIADSKGESTYQKPGIYVTSASVTGNMLTLKRATRNADGTYLPTSDDQIINNVSQATNVVTLSTITTDLKETELVLNFAYTVTSANKLSNNVPAKIIFNTINSLSVRNVNSTSIKYYVYAKGKMMNIFNSLADAIIEADNEYGVVVDEAGNYIWARISKEVTMQLSSTATALAGVNGVQMTGISLEEALYYTSNNEGVAFVAVDGTRYIISAYSGPYSGKVTSVTLINASTKESKNYSYSEVDEMCKAAGNKFIGMYE